MTIKGIWFVIAPIILYFIYLIPYTQIYNSFIVLDKDDKIGIILTTLVISIVADIFVVLSYDRSFIIAPFIQGVIYIGNILNKVSDYILKIINNIVNFINKHLTVKI